MHRRRVVRDAAVAQLMGLALTGDRVFNTRTKNISDSQLPALRVFTPQEQSAPEGDSLMSNTHLHRIEIRVEAVAKAADDVEDVIDAICEQIEAALDADQTLSGATAWVRYQSTDIEFEDEDQTVMQATLSFEAAFIQE